MKYNIIGDIHGRTCWKDLVIDDGINIFVGDYFSPYHQEITWEQQLENFFNIIKYKEEHPKTILLIGNHDEDHWHWCVPNSFSGCSRHNFEHEQEIKELFERYKHYFLAAYAIENKTLITHAGLSMQWYMRMKYKPVGKYQRSSWDINKPDLNKLENISVAFDKFLDLYEEQVAFGRLCDRFRIREDYETVFWNNRWYYWLNGQWNLFTLTPTEAASFINWHWIEKPMDFSFSINAKYNDYYGTSETHSPMWIRYEGLQRNNPFSGTNFEQIYGHTISEDIKTYFDYDPNDWSKFVETGKMVMIDCLEYKKESYIVNF